MLKKEIEYEDLDGNKLTETFWFHLSKAELAEMAVSKEGKAGGLDTWVRNLIQSQDGEVLVSTFKKILLSTIGERSADNKYFIKNDEIRQRFEGSDAYSVLFMEIMTDADKMTAFIDGVVPASMREELAKQIENTPDLATFQAQQTQAPNPEMQVVEQDNRPDWLKDPSRVPTESELKGATPEQMMEAFRRKSAGAGPVTQEEITGS